MEINDQNLAALGQYLQQTLSTSAETRKTAENFLRECENEKGTSFIKICVTNELQVMLYCL